MSFRKLYMDTIKSGGERVGSYVTKSGCLLRYSKRVWSDQLWWCTAWSLTADSNRQISAPILPGKSLFLKQFAIASSTNFG